MKKESIEEICKKVKDWVQSPEGQKAIEEGLEKAQKFIEDMKADERKRRMDKGIYGTNTMRGISVS